MAESEFSQENIAEIRSHLNRIEELTRLSLALNPNAEAALDSDLRAKKGSANLYLCLGSGPLDQASLMRMTGQTQSNISKICSHLCDIGLITSFANPANRRAKLYARNLAVEKSLKVEKIAKKVDADEAKV